VSGESEPNVRQAVPFFMVCDMEALVRFYVDGLGFEITHRWVGDDGKLCWCCMRNGEAALMLQEYSREGHGGGRPEGKLGLGVSICFVCRDALAIYREVKARGVAAETPFVGNAMWVTSLTDPDGYRTTSRAPRTCPKRRCTRSNSGGGAR
jgi:lactoylglutathione lyase